MNLSVEAQHVDLAPEWVDLVDQKLSSLSDPRDPVISARSTFSVHEGEHPPAEVKLMVNLRGKYIVIHKQGDTIEAALKAVLDTAKREIRRYYELRSSHRPRTPAPGFEPPVINYPDEGDMMS